jgi:PTH2 family peptidyl-tRNA hydrolase
MTESHLKTLQEMGFDKEDCESALKESEGNLDLALNILESRTLPRYKLVFLVRTDLGMGTGKIAAQVGHAAIGAYQQCPRSTLSKWEECGTAKIVLQVSSLEELQTLEQCAKAVGLATYTVEDAGRTQIESGSVTVCAIGPDEEEKINQVTGSLKLFR